MSAIGMPIQPEDIAVAIAWAMGEVKLADIRKANSVEDGGRGTTVYVYLARALREAVQQGKLKISASPELPSEKQERK